MDLPWFDSQVAGSRPKKPPFDPKALAVSSLEAEEKGRPAGLSSSQHRHSYIPKHIRPYFDDENRRCRQSEFICCSTRPLLGNSLRTLRGFFFDHASREVKGLRPETQTRGYERCSDCLCRGLASESDSLEIKILSNVRMWPKTPAHGG